MSTPIKALIIVEDEAWYRRYLRIIFDGAFPHAGIVTRMCSSGSEALLAIRDGGTWDIAIVDVHLGDVPGEKVLEALRNSSPATKIVVLTSISVNEETHHDLRTHADEVIIKDRVQEHLIPLLENWLGVEAKKGEGTP